MKYYLDTEFNGMGGDLISLALVAAAGGEIYFSLRCNNPVPWVAKNVIPVMSCTGAHAIKVTPHILAISIANFFFHMKDSDPVIIADWPDDISYFCKALITGPGQMVNIPTLTFKLERVDAYPTDLRGAVQHNALWDARALQRKLTRRRK